MPGSASWGLLVAVVLFVGFLVFKSRLPLVGADPARANARKRIADAKRRARDSGADRARRARAWRDAAGIALDELRRPNLAASYARRAERADPDDAESVGMLARVLRRATRYRALEKLLWRRLADDKRGDAWDRAFDELLSLYEGPLRRPAQARVLRKLRGDAAGDA